MNFKDHFSTESDRYRQFRPRYPQELFEFLAKISPGNNRAWDCATGNGQTASFLVRYFQEVIATDASANQIESAEKIDGIQYRVEKSENTSIESESVDLTTVSQAIHWFDLDKFEKEVIRVLKHRGILAVWTYGLTSINPSIDKLVSNLCYSILDSYWPPERKMIDEGYSGIKFSMEELAVPTFQMSTRWNYDQFTGYLSTWSAVKRYREANQVDPISLIGEDMLSQWGNRDDELFISWPLSLRVWRKPQEN